MNERDSEQVARMFVEGGYTVTPSEFDADAILVNTCSVRDQAEQKALGKMGIMGKHRRKKPHVVYGFMGCMAQSRGNELFKTTPHLDVVVGTQKYHKVFEYVDDILSKRMEMRMDDPSLALTGESVCDVEEEKAARIPSAITWRRKIKPRPLFPLCRAVTCDAHSVLCRIHVGKSAVDPLLTLCGSVKGLLGRA